MVVLEENMKRVFIMLTAVLMMALAVFSVNTSAYVIDGSCREVDSRNCRITAKVSDSEAISSRTGDSLLDVQSATEFDADEIKEDGINTRVATVWIVCICAVCVAAVAAFVVVMAKKNRGEK